MNVPTIHTIRKESLIDFLQLHEMEVERIEATDATIYRVVRDGELPVYLDVGDEVLSFEVDLGSIAEIGSEELFKQLLDANTEIQPVCFGLNSTNHDDPRLVLAESRVIGDLSDQEILSVFDALELAADRAEEILAPFLK